MSGLFGYLSGNGADALPLVTRMGQRMCHTPRARSEQLAVTPEVAIGRLHIGIFNQHAQPLRSPNGRVWLWLCGEFYHQQQRRQELLATGALRPAASDEELALAVYLRDGIAGLTGLDGAFTIALWDAERAELLLVNDRYGLYPHYYTQQQGFIFAPEIKAILQIPQVSRATDPIALAEYAQFQQFLGERTWFADIKLVPPASVLRYDLHADRLTIERYWDWDAIQSLPSISFEEAVHETILRFQRAIDAMSNAPFRPGVYLSGGLDGRLILGFMRQPQQVATITFGAPGCRDVVYGRRIAKAAGAPSYWEPFYDGRWVEQHAPLHLALTEGMHSWAHAHGISVLNEAQQHMDVNLSGWDGGTILGGLIDEYDIDHRYRHPSSEDDLLHWYYHAFCRRLTWPGLTESEADTLLQQSPLRGLAFEGWRDEFTQTQQYPSDRRADYIYLRHGARRLTQSMIVIARSAIEVRCPFFDYRFIEWIYGLPEEIRTTPELQRAVLTKRAPRLALIPRDQDDRLPHSNKLIRGGHDLLQRSANRINRHFAPIFPRYETLYADYETYLRTDLRQWAEDILFDPRTLERGLFDPAVMHSLWERHMSGKELWTIGKIAPFITIELALRMLVDDEQPQPMAVGAHMEA